MINKEGCQREKPIKKFKLFKKGQWLIEMHINNVKIFNEMELF